MIPLAWLEEFLPMVELLDSYGEAIEYDLFDRGWNILDWFNGRYPLSQLQRIIEKLPEGSHYRAAILEDRDLALYLVENNLIDSEAHEPPSLVGYDRLISKLDQLYDLLASQLNQQGAKLDPAERPRRAIDAVQFDKAFERHLDRVRQVLPRKNR